VEIGFVILADSVRPAEGGKLDLIGAAIDTVSSRTAPFEHESLTLLARVLLSPGEVGRVHRFDVSLVGADGTEVVSTTRETDPVEAPQGEGRRASVGFVLELKNLPFPSFGLYQFVISWDGHEVHRVGLVAQPMPG
jgi:hypothetical protein